MEFGPGLAVNTFLQQRWLDDCGMDNEVLAKLLLSMGETTNNSFAFTVSSPQWVLWRRGWATSPTVAVALPKLEGTSS
jgi:hypothetical protein